MFWVDPTAQVLQGASAELEPLGTLMARRSVAPRRLGWPGPTQAQLALMIDAALRAPDHGGLSPWRAIHIRPENRHELAELFAQEKQRRDPLVSAGDLARAREHATNAPTLLAFAACIRVGATVPVHEQWLAAGAALGNMLNALHAMGFGAIVLSGDRCGDALLASQLGLQEGEKLVGFISAGTVRQLPPAALCKPTDSVWSTWRGPQADTPEHSSSKAPAQRGENPCLASTDCPSAESKYSAKFEACSDAPFSTTTP